MLCTPVVMPSGNVTMEPAVWPAPEVKLFAAIAAETSAAVRPWAASLLGSSQARTAKFSAPQTSAFCTPRMDCICGCTTRVR